MKKKAIRSFEAIDEIAYRRLELKESLATIGERYGVSRQRIAQILKEEGWTTCANPPVAFHCSCGKLIYSRRYKKCRDCRRQKKERPLCMYCGEQGGYKNPVCKKHEWVWRYYEAPGSEKRRRQISEHGKRRRSVRKET